MRNGPALPSRTSSRKGDSPSVWIKSFTRQHSDSDRGPRRHHRCPATGVFNLAASSCKANCTCACNSAGRASAVTRMARSRSPGRRPTTPGWSLTLSHNRAPSARRPRTQSREKFSLARALLVRSVQNGRKYTPPQPLPRNH